MKVISIITQKGGVGKTTSTIHIGGALEQAGYKVLLIDFDTQCNLSLGCDIKRDFPFNVEDFLLTTKTPKFTPKGKFNRLFVLAGSETLKERKLKQNSLKTALKKVEKNFDFVLIDCPPKPINDELSFGEIAVFASDFVISPIKSDRYSIDGIVSFISSVNSLKKNSGLKTHILGFFFNEVEEKTTHFLGFYEMLKNSTAKNFLFKNYIRKDVNVKNAMDLGKTVFELRPDGRAGRDFQRLTEELLTKIN